MNCHCYLMDDLPYRQKFINQRNNQHRKQRQRSKNKKSAHFGMKLLNALGLRQYVLNKFVFKPVPPKYEFIDKMEKIGKKVTLFKLKNSRQIVAIQGYQFLPKLLEQNDHSIPMLHLKLTNDQTKNKPTIIYSHGNSSDLSDAYIFFAKLLKKIPVNVCIYDYSGYGISKSKKINQQTICKDLQLVVKQLNIQYHKIILWGFSLGSFPTITLASHNNFGGVILQSPIASAASYFDEQTKQYCRMDDTHYTYDFDCLDNLKNIGEIRSSILIMHSTADQVIPIAQALKLYSVIKAEGKSSQHFMVEVPKLRHNQMHYFLSQEKSNPLNEKLKSFIKSVQNKIQLNQQSKNKKQNEKLMENDNEQITLKKLNEEDATNDDKTTEQKIHKKYFTMLSSPIKQKKKIFKEIDKQ